MDKMSVRYVGHFFLILLTIQVSVAPPTKNHAKNETQEEKVTLDDLGLEYNRYLKEIVETLESDKEFAKKLQSASDSDFKNGKIAEELEYVNHNVRTKLDELKRTELQRLRDLVAQLDEQPLQKKRDEMHEHLDHSNPHTFEVADLHNLIIKVRKDLDEADRMRKENFKEYELEKEFEKEQKLKAMDEEHKKEYLKELEEQKKKHQQHDPIHHPGGKAQLEEVWEKTDHMEDVKFNPKAFFFMHDIDSNGYWDEQEVNALFLKELDKMYQAGLPEDDMREREEEMERMREHVFKETDTNQDRLISLDEFIEQTKKQEFQRDDGWETLDEKPQFSREEYLEFEKRRQQEINEMIQRGMIPPGHYPNQGYQMQYHPDQLQHLNQVGQHPNQMGQYQTGHPNQMGQYPNQMGQHPNQMGQHPNQMGQHPNQMGQYPNQMGQHPNQMGQHPNQMGQHPNQMGQHPNQMGQHPNQMGQHPNQMGQHPNQMGQYPNQMPQHPNQMPQHPNQMSQHPNQMPQHPNQVPQHPNQVPQHPNQVPQHPNQVPQHPNQVPQHPNQAPQHPNQVPQYQNQVPQQVNQAPQQPNQVPQQTNQVPQQANQVPQQQNQVPQQANQVPQQPNQIPQQQANYEPHGSPDSANKV